LKGGNQHLWPAQSLIAGFMSKSDSVCRECSPR
jgi:hypothetical protein